MDPEVEPGHHLGGDVHVERQSHAGRLDFEDVATYMYCIHNSLRFGVKFFFVRKCETGVILSSLVHRRVRQHCDGSHAGDI